MGRFAVFKSLVGVGAPIKLPSAVLVLCILGSSVLFANDKGFGESVSGKIQNIFQERRNAVVRVRATDSLGIRLGSGFFVDPTGTIYTHAGIVLKADDVTVNFNNRSFPARVIVADDRSGIAILKVESISPFIPLGDSEKADVATPVIAIGYPEEREESPCFGMIAGRDRQYLGQFFSTTHLRANMAAQRGQGGAPVLNLSGEAIGILVGRIGDGASCHILPIRAAEKVRKDISRFGELRPGWVGAEVEDAKESAHGSTATVAHLDPETPAAKCGLQQGDVILSIGGMPVKTSEDVIDAAYFLTAGESSEVLIVRNGEKMSIPVQPMLHPRAPGKDLHADALSVPGPTVAPALE
jgi:serine protease Do